MSMTETFTAIAENEDSAHDQLVAMTKSLLLEHPDMSWSDAFARVTDQNREIFNRYAAGEGVSHDRRVENA